MKSKILIKKLRDINRAVCSQKGGRSALRGQNMVTRKSLKENQNSKKITKCLQSKMKERSLILGSLAQKEISRKNLKIKNKKFGLKIKKALPSFDYEGEKLKVSLEGDNHKSNFEDCSSRCKSLDRKNQSSYVSRRFNYTKREKILSNKVRNGRNGFSSEIKYLMERAKTDPDNPLVNILLGKYDRLGSNGTLKCGNLEEKKSEKSQKLKKNEKDNTPKISADSLRILDLSSLGKTPPPLKPTRFSSSQKSRKIFFNQNNSKISKTEKFSKSDPYRTVYTKKFSTPSKKIQDRYFNSAEHFYTPVKLGSYYLSRGSKMTGMKQKIKKLRGSLNSRLKDRMDKPMDINPLRYSYNHERSQNKMKGGSKKFHSFNEEFEKIKRPLSKKSITRSCWSRKVNIGHKSGIGSNVKRHNSRSRAQNRTLLRNTRAVIFRKSNRFDTDKMPRRPAKGLAGRFHKRFFKISEDV